MWGRQGKATIIVKNGSGSGSVWGGQERGDPRRSCHLTLFVNFGESWIVLPLYLQCFCPLGALSLLGLHVVPGAVHAIDSPCCWLRGSAHTSCVLSDTAFWCPLKWLLCSVVLYSFVSHPCPKKDVLVTPFHLRNISWWGTAGSAAPFASALCRAAAGSGVQVLVCLIGWAGCFKSLHSWKNKSWAL